MVEYNARKSYRKRMFKKKKYENIFLKFSSASMKNGLSFRSLNLLYKILGDIKLLKRQNGVQCKPCYEFYNVFRNIVPVGEPRKSNYFYKIHKNIHSIYTHKKILNYSMRIFVKCVRKQKRIERTYREKLYNEIVGSIDSKNMSSISYQFKKEYERNYGVSIFFLNKLRLNKIDREELHAYSNNFSFTQRGKKKLDRLLIPFDVLDQMELKNLTARKKRDDNDIKARIIREEKMISFLGGFEEYYEFLDLFIVKKKKYKNSNNFYKDLNFKNLVINNKQVNFFRSYEIYKNRNEKL